jgi:hypothetical protein
MLKKLKPTPSYKIENSKVMEKVIELEEIASKEAIVPTFTANETYMYAILPASGSSKEYKIYIGKGAHYYIAHFSDEAIIAGDIVFGSDNAIKEINDQSGTYHLSPDISLPERNEIMEKQKEALCAVGINPNLLIRFESKETPKLIPH